MSAAAHRPPGSDPDDLYAGPRTAQARVRTDRASRYLAQLCRHLSELQSHTSPAGHERAGPGRPQIRHVEWSDTRGTVDLAAGRLTLLADPDTLHLTIEAPDEQRLASCARPSPTASRPSVGATA